VSVVVSDPGSPLLANSWFRNCTAPLILVRTSESLTHSLTHSFGTTTITRSTGNLTLSFWIYPYQDADSIAHTVYRPGSQAVKDVAEAFGSDNVIDSNGEIDRKKLGSIVFSDLEDMKKLERIVWPHVKQDILDQIQRIKDEWKGDGLPIVVVEAAVLLDADWQGMMSGVLVVTASPSVALDRLVENRGLSREEAEKRVAAQLSRRGIGNLEEEVRNKVVTAVIDNSGSLDDLQQALSQTVGNASTWYL
jgi:dephospho-CoA kinase